jgi:hypothetical protein
MFRSTCLLLVTVALSPPLHAEEKTKEIFNGKDLDGWVVEGAKEYKDKDDSNKTKRVWTAEDGLLKCAGRDFGFLRYSKQEYADFALHVEYRMTPKCNSGICIRAAAYDPAKDSETRPSFYSYEIQLLDDADKPANKYSSGSLYRYVAPKENAVKPAPEWNTVDVECVGPRIKITINGKEVIDIDQSTIEEIKNKPLKGYVSLQNHGGKLDFRNIRIREIKADKDK